MALSSVHRNAEALQVRAVCGADVTNRMDLFYAPDLHAGPWRLAAPPAAPDAAGAVAWTAAPDPGARCGFFRAADADADGDADGLSDARESLLYHTRTDTVDTDGDGLADGYSGAVPTNACPGGVAGPDGTVAGELSHGTSALSADSDGDGLGDGEEVRGRTDPNNADATPPAVQLLWPPPGRLELMP